MLSERGISLVEAARSLGTQIKPRAEEIEAARKLPQDIADAFVDAGFVQMGIAKCYGGLESAPLEIMEVIEIISEADASAGWCLMNFQTSALLSGSIPPRWAESVFGGAEPCIPSGVLAPTGIGEQVEGGIKVSGRWSFGSGCPNANWFFGMTAVENEVVLAIFSADQFKTEDNWRVAGLCGTGSGDVTVKDAFVPDDCWWIPGSPPFVETPLFQIPLSTIFPPTVASVSLGVADAALREFEAMVNGSTNSQLNHPTVQAGFAKAEALVGAARSYLHRTTEAMWSIVEAGNPLLPNERRAARLAAAHATASCAHAVDLLFHTAGSSSLLLEQPLQRYWRDANAITKHIQVSAKNFETMGKLALTGELDGQL